MTINIGQDLISAANCSAGINGAFLREQTVVLFRLWKEINGRIVRYDMAQ